MPSKLDSIYAFVAAAQYLGIRMYESLAAPWSRDRSIYIFEGFAPAAGPLGCRELLAGELGLAFLRLRNRVKWLSVGKNDLEIEISI